MALARQELGADAMLVEGRRSAPEARHLGEYEVVVATDLPAAGPDNTAQSPDVPQSNRLSLEVAELKKELEGMRRAITRSTFSPPPWAGMSPNLSEGYTALNAAEVAPGLIREILQGATARLQARSGATFAASSGPAFQQALAEEMESRISASPALGAGSGPRIVALVGPPGAGKTTTLVKLAVNYGLLSRRPVLLLSADTYRVAAAEQLRAYAAILGAGFQVVETVVALAQSLEENRGKDPILIDTPGFGFDDLDAAAPLAAFLCSRSDIDVQLVLPASMKAADLTRMGQAFGIFHPRRLLFTRLDETASFGPLFTEAARTALPLSFFATGQRIPEDLETASPARLVEMVFAGERARKTAAA
jgi:flagellar biosynthesis protein FlhF